MLSDSEITHLNRSIALHKQKQSEEIEIREKEIHRLRLENATLQSQLSQHYDQHAQVKERLVKTMTELEMRGAMIDAEKDRANRAIVAKEQAEGALEMTRQERESFRKRLAEAETLVASASSQRAQLADLEQSLMHGREQVRLMHDSKSALDSQLLITNRDLESQKWKVGSLEARVESLIKEKSTVTEECSELRQALAKQRSSHAEEVAEFRRDIQRIQDNVETERTKRFRRYCTVLYCTVHSYLLYPHITHSVMTLSELPSAHTLIPNA